MKKIILIIILSLTAFVAILFLIAFIDHIVNDPKKEIDRIINGFQNNRQDFIIIKDYIINSEYESTTYIYADNYADLMLSDSEYESFSRIFNSLNYKYVGFFVPFDEATNTIEFRCGSRFMVRQIVYIDDDENSHNNEYNQNHINLGDGWCLYSFGVV